MTSGRSAIVCTLPLFTASVANVRIGNGKDGPLCYEQMSWIENYLNQDSVKKELGAPKELKFESCNMCVPSDCLRAFADSLRVTHRQVNQSVS